MRRIVSVFIFVFGLVSPVFAGAIYVNDTGQVAHGFRIVFSSPVVITSHAPSLPVQEPEGEASAFVFSGGEVPPRGSFWLSWRPGDAEVVGYEWITEKPYPQAPARADISPEAEDEHLRREEYRVEFVGPEGKTIPVTIVREKSRDMMPFLVRYRLRLPGEYKAVAVADDPGLFWFPGDGDLRSVLIPSLRIDDFNDVNMISYLGTDWQFVNTDPTIKVCEVGKDVFGYGLMFNGSNGVSLNLNSLDGSDYAGIYLRFSAPGLTDWNKSIKQLTISLNSITYLLNKSSSHLHSIMQPYLLKVPLSEFRGMGLFSLEDLIISIDSGSNPMDRHNYL